MATLTQPETQTSPGMRRDSAGAPAPAPAPKPGGRRSMAFALMGIALAGLLAVGARHWWFNRSHVSSDDAQVDGHIIPILPKVGGFVMAVRVDENKQVKEGDTLVVLDDRDYRVRLAQAEADLAVALASVNNRARVGQAEAQVEQAQANALKAHADLDRLRPLAAQDIVSKQQLDPAQATAPAADARLAAARAGPGRAFLAAAAGQRDGEFHEGRAAPACAYPARPGRSGASAPARDERERGDRHPVAGR